MITDSFLGDLIFVGEDPAMTCDPAPPGVLLALRLLQAWATDVMGLEGTPIPEDHPIMVARTALAAASQGTP